MSCVSRDFEIDSRCGFHRAPASSSFRFVEEDEDASGGTVATSVQGFPRIPRNYKLINRRTAKATVYTCWKREDWVISFLPGLQSEWNKVIMRFVRVNWGKFWGKYYLDYLDDFFLFIILGLLVDWAFVWESLLEGFCWNCGVRLFFFFFF